MTPKLLALWQERFTDVPLYCSSEDAVGVDEIEELRDFSLRESTKDQRRIEDYLTTRCAQRAVVMHVGIGSSGLAKSFQAIVRMIVGITIQKNELEHAEKLRIPNYYTFLLNKYSFAYAHTFSPDFDFVIDNNPSTFSCCFLHFARMMTTYRGLLADGGQIVTDRVGLGWVVTQGNPRWKFDFDDWAHIANALELRADNVNGCVYTMRRH